MTASFVSRFWTFVVLIALSPVSAIAQKTECASIGDTVTVTGSVTPGINGGTYFVLLKKLCVHYPKKTDRFAPISLETVGDKLPPSVYVELTGELSDPWPVVGVGIKVRSFRSVDVEVRKALADWQGRCERWQDENSAALRERTHGGNISRIENNDGSPGHQCGIAAADTKLPHESTTIWRPATADK
jgi:hypothetical protein